jgi:hypothetical protein
MQPDRYFFLFLLAFFFAAFFLAVFFFAIASYLHVTQTEFP